MEFTTTTLEVENISTTIDIIASGGAKTTLVLTGDQKLRLLESLLPSYYEVFGCDTCGKVDAIVGGDDLNLGGDYYKCGICGVKRCVKCVYNPPDIVFLENVGDCHCYEVLCGGCALSKPDDYVFETETEEFACKINHLP